MRPAKSAFSGRKKEVLVRKWGGGNTGSAGGGALQFQRRLIKKERSKWIEIKIYNRQKGRSDNEKEGQRNSTVTDEKRLKKVET